jgi:hypothetical protein
MKRSPHPLICVALVSVAMVMGGGLGEAARAQDFVASSERIQLDLEALCLSGPREMGSGALESAVAYTEAELRRAGLEPWRERVDGAQRWDAGYTPVRLRGSQGAGPVFPLTALGRSPALLPGSHELLDLGWGSPEDFAEQALRIPGRVVLMLEGWEEDRDPTHRIEKVFLASDAGATAVIFHHPSGEDFRGVAAWPSDARIAALALEDGMGLRESLDAGQRLRLEALREEAVPPSAVDVGAENLLAELAGSPVLPEVLLLSAHLDAWELGQGALDDAAGVAVVLEVARLLGARSWQGRRPVRFALFTGEELGLQGSQAHLARCLDGDRSLPALVLNLEMPEAPAGFVIYSGEGLRPLLAPLLLTHRELGLDAGVGESLDLYSDHVPFLLAGIPAMGLRYHRDEDSDRRIHTAADRLDTLDPEALAACAQLVAATLWALSEPRAPLPDRLDEAQLSGWFSSQGGDLDRARRRGY